MNKVFVVLDFDEYEKDTVRGVYDTMSAAKERCEELEVATLAGKELEGSKFVVREYMIGVPLGHFKTVGLPLDPRCAAHSFTSKVEFPWTD